MKKCRLSGASFEISAEDIEYYRKLNLPPPTLCPAERNRRRMSFRNFRTLSRRKCSATGTDMISMYDDSVPFPVYEKSYWLSDAWDAADHCMNINPEQPFFEQYAELSRKVPRYNLINIDSENSDYCNAALSSRNCYLVFGCVRNEDCLYGHIVWDCKNCLDNLYIYRCEWCSHNVDLAECYDVHFSSECINCRESYFLDDCIGCSRCFGCYNLRHREYCFFNKQLSKAAYEHELARLLPLSAQTIAETSAWLQHEVCTQGLFPAYFALRCDDCTGNHLYDSVRLANCFDAKSCEDSKHLYTAFDVQNCRDLSFTGGSGNRFCVEGLTNANCNQVFFSHLVQSSRDCAYCEFCYSSHDLFGCNGLRNKRYCILNKQYEREEYFRLREQLVDLMTSRGEFGEFFPVEMSPFAYNESIAQEYMPLTGEQARALGWCWKENKQQERTVKSDSNVRVCKESGRAFKIIKSEMEFYRRMDLPSPELCPDIRHEKRMALRAKRNLRLRPCSFCGEALDTAHSSSHIQRVACLRCYAKLHGGEEGAVRRQI